MLCFVTAGLDTRPGSVLVCTCVNSHIAGSRCRMWRGWGPFGGASASFKRWVSTCQLLRWTSTPFGEHRLLSMRRIQGSFFFFPSLQITLPLFRLKYQNLMVCRISAKKSIISETAKIIAPIDQIGRRMVCPPAQVRKDKSWSFLKHAQFA